MYGLYARVSESCTYLKQNRTLCLWKMQAFLSICYPAGIIMPTYQACKFFTVYLLILCSVFISSDFYVLISGSGRPLFSAWLASYIHFSFSSTVACYVLHWTRRQKCDHSVTSTRGVASNQILGGQEGTKIIYLTGKQINGPSSGNRILFSSSQ